MTLFWRRLLPSRWQIKQWFIDVTKAFSESIKWSSLATIGDSPLLKLTIIIPFIGYIIIYNDYLLKFLSLSQIHTGQIGETPGDNISVTASRLNYIYFGLTALGIASFLFTLRAPKEILKHRASVDYVLYMQQVDTSNIVRTSLTEVLDFFRSVNSQDTYYKKSDIFYPDSLSYRIHLLVEDIYSDSEDTEINNDESEDAEFDSDLYTVSGQIRTDTVAERALSGVAIYRYYEGIIFVGAKKYSKDVFFLEHIVRDYSKFFMRLIVAILYLFGFLLLFIPTIMTSYNLLNRWIFS